MTRRCLFVGAPASLLVSPSFRFVPLLSQQPPPPQRHQHQQYELLSHSIDPIKLFYTGNMPIVLQTALVSNIYFMSQLFYNAAPNNPLVQLLGQWRPQEGTGNLIPVGGIAYFISPPMSFAEILYDPFHAVFYVVFLLTFCAIFSKAWMEIAGNSPRDVARQFRENQMTIKGYRESGVIRVLNRYIPTAAALGGMIIGAITVLADFLGCIGTGTGILLAVTTIYSYYEEFAVERKQMMGQFGL